VLTVHDGTPLSSSYVEEATPRNRNYRGRRQRKPGDSALFKTVGLREDHRGGEGEEEKGDCELRGQLQGSAQHQLALQKGNT